MLHRLRSQLVRGASIAIAAASLLFSPAISLSVSAAPFAQTNPSPQGMLLGYYSAINLKLYAQAYADWLAPTQSYADFASGYLTTDHVLPYFGDWQPAPANGPANELGRIPALLYSYHSDGSVAAYNGCFFIGSAGGAQSSGNIWKIVNANFKLFTASGYFPTATVLSTALAVDCYGTPASLTAGGESNPVADKGQAMLNNYYSLINKRDYLNAYAQWLQPLPGPKPNGAPAQDYRLAYADFVAGYQDTTYIFAYLGAFNEEGASAGHGYLDGVIPAVLVGEHSDGSAVSYYGCYVVGYLPNGQLGIVSGKFMPIQEPYTLSGKSIGNYLSLDCTTLTLQY